MGVQFAGNILVQSNGGPLPISQGGTGQTTAPNAINALMPTQSGNAGKVLTTNGSVVSWTTIGAGTPGGSDTQIQFNDSGTFGGNAFLTVNKSTGAVTSTSTLTNTGLTITNSVSTYRNVKYQTSGSDRWLLAVNNEAESGANSGSNFEFTRVADNGSTQNIVFSVARSSGVVDFKQAPTINGVQITTGGTPGGSNTQIQYNSSGTFAGSANFAFDGTNKVTLNGTLTGNDGGANGTGGLTIRTGDPASGTPGVLTIRGGTSNSAAAAGAISIIAGSSTAAGNGGALTLAGGSCGAAGGGGGTVTIHSDVSGGFGGTINIRGGDTPSNAQDGGSVTIRGGNSLNGSTSGNGGNVTISGGYSTTVGVGGYISLQTGVNTSVTERLRILNNGAWSVGTGGTATGTSGQVLTSNGSGSAPTWQTPSASASSLVGTTGATGGAATATGGTSTTAGNAGGPVTITGGVNSTAGAGGAVSVTGGAGVANNATLRNGGSVTIQGGTSDTLNASAQGGNVIINGGQGGSASAIGGAIVLQTAANNTLVERFRILNNGSWSVGSNGTSTGTSGQVLTSNGSGSAPTWQTVSAAATSFTTLTGSNSGSVNTITTATGSSSGTALAITVGDSTVTPGLLVIQGGTSTATSGTGGTLQLRGGTGGGAGSTTGGQLILRGALGTGSGGPIIFSTAPTTTDTERFRILANGAWSVGANGTDTGTSGQVLTSNGSGSAPTWQASSASVLNGTSAYSATPQNTTGVYVGTSGSQPRIFFTNTAAATGRRNSQIYNNGTSMIWTFINDANSAETAWLNVALPTNNTSQVSPSIALNSATLSLGDGASQSGSNPAVSAWVTTPNVSGAANSMLVMPGQNTAGTGAATTLTVAGALRNNAGTAGQVTVIGGQNTSTGAAGNAVISGGNQTGSASGAGGHLLVYGGAGGASGTGGYIAFNTAASNTHAERFRILANGAWSVGANGTDTGSTSQVLKSNGSGSAPTWGEVASSGAPATASSTGRAGEVRYDSSFIYVCVATNTWVRAALSTW